MEILNILYNNNNIAFYLIGAILVVIIIFIVISSMYTTPKEEKKEEILKDPIEDEKNIPNVLEINNEIKKEEIKEVIKEETKDIPKINDIVESIYQKSINIEEEVKEEKQDLNSFLQEFEVPNNIIEEVVSSDKEENSLQNETEIEIPLLKNDDILVNDENDVVVEPAINTHEQKQENIENMLKRLYDLRQNENNARKNALLSEIYDLKKQVDETLKSTDYNYALDYNDVDTKALADYYLFNEDIEFPKLK